MSLLLDSLPEYAPASAVRKAICARRILLVEDEPLTAEVFARALSRAGHDVTIATDGIQALRQSRLRPPELVILDMSLPRASGADVLRQLRAEGRLDLPVLVVSGSPRQQCSLTADELSPGAWIDKPVKPRILLQLVEEHLAARGE